MWGSYAGNKRKLCQAYYTENKDELCKEGVPEEIATKRQKNLDYFHAHKEKFTYKSPLLKEKVNCDTCGKELSNKYALKRHMEFHEGITVKCTICDKDISRPNFDKHLKFHQGDKSFACDICEYTFVTSCDLKRHKYTHIDNDARPHKCSDCGIKYSRPYLLKLHYTNTHTKEGQQVRKKKEERISQLLQSHNISFDRELHVNYTCFETSFKYARVDFSISRDWGHILLEVDEDQHATYEQLCETTRMSNICSALVGQGKIVFLRYNPDGFTVDGERTTRAKSTRHEKLIDTILHYTPSMDLEIVYQNYSMSNGKPSVYYETGYGLREYVHL